MTDVADPYDRDDNDVSIVPGLEDVTQLNDDDLDEPGTDRGVPEREDSDIYTQTVKAPGVGEDNAVPESGRADTFTEAVSVPSDPVVDPVETNPLVHGLGTAGDDERRTVDTGAPDEDGLEFGLGSENTQDTPPTPHPAEGDGLKHGLES